MKGFLILSIYILIFNSIVFSQQKEDIKKDSTTTLKGFFLHGKFKAHIRTYFMNTINKKELKDYSALAIGAGIGYETPKYKRFQAGFSGFFIFNLASSNLTKPDPLTNQFSRYELGLFDLTDPKNKTNLDRLEELYLKYNFKKTDITVGRQVLKTPFINPQDGRMRPTLEEAIWINSNDIKNISLQGGWINRVSPRSTMQWYSIGKSIGVYSPGVDEFGKLSAYANNTTSKGIAILGSAFDNQKIKVQLWDTYVENVMNTILVQADKKIELKNKNSITAGIQFISQRGTGNGGNADTAKQYFKAENKAFVISGRIGYETKKYKADLNYTRIAGKGRYLMPREWGVDPFYTFLPRERNEGYGNVNAISTNFMYTSAKPWEFRIGYGHYYLPDAEDFENNKYGFPSYCQLNMQATYRFKGFLDGLDMNLLIVYKNSLGNEHNNLKYVDNKVNMLNSSLVFNYLF